MKSSVAWRKRQGLKTLVRRRMQAAFMLLASLLPLTASAYPGATHQSLTFLAARLFNQCADRTGGTPLTAMQVRYIARATVDMADRSAFVRMFRWNYYAPPGYASRALGGLVDTRFNRHYELLVRAIGSAQSEVDLLEAHGAVNFYLHHVTTPQRVVPVYTNRVWRMSFSDRFDDVLPQEARIIELLGDPCAHILDAEPDLDRLLHVLAEETRARVREPISRHDSTFESTWEAFWKFGPADGEFGEYGVAGNNFGRDVEFPCGAGTCVLLDDDPLYLEFAAGRHAAAVSATLQLLAHLRSRNTTANPENVNAE